MRILILFCLMLAGCMTKNLNNIDNKKIELTSEPIELSVADLKESQKHDIETPVKYFLYIIGAVMLLNFSLMFLKNE